MSMGSTEYGKITWKPSVIQGEVVGTVRGIFGRRAGEAFGGSKFHARPTEPLESRAEKILRLRTKGNMLVSLPAPLSP